MEVFGTWPLALHRARVLRPLTWKNLNLGWRSQAWILQLLFIQQGDGNFWRMSLFVPCVLDADVRRDCVRILCVSQFWSRLFLSPWQFSSLRGSFLHLQSSANGCVCQLSCFCRIIWASDLLISLFGFLQVGSIVLFQVCWAPGRKFWPANLINVRPQGRKS